MTILDQQRFDALMKAISAYIQSSNLYESRARNFDAALLFARANHPREASIFEGCLEIVRSNPEPLQATDADYREHVALGQKVLELAADVAQDLERRSAPRKGESRQ